jgi:predicted DNA-binding transcriptional regulator AlpA
VSKNSIQKIGKRVVTRGSGGAVALISNRSDGGPGHRPQARGPPPPDAVWIDAPQLLARYGGRSHMFLVRLLERDATFPRPMKIGRLRYFKLAELVAWERKQAARAA